MYGLWSGNLVEVLTRLVRFLGYGGGEAVTPEVERARARHRRIVLTAGTSAAAKATSVATMLISLPLTLNYLGPERYGIWATISSFSLMLAFADLGIGNGVLTAIARSSGQNDILKIRGYVSSAAAVLLAIGGLIALAGLIVPHFVDWAGIFNVSDGTAGQEIGLAMTAFLLCFGLSLPTTLIQRVQMGMQRGFLSNLWQCLASALALVAVIYAAHVSAPLPWLIAAFLVPPLAIGLLNSFIFFGYMMPSIAPAPKFVSSPLIAEVVRVGGMFLALQVAMAVAFFSDSFLISRTLGAAYVTEYSIAERLFSPVSQLIALVVLPLWPAMGEALARKDWTWAWRTLAYCTLGALGVSLLMSMALLMGAPTIIHHWIGEGFDVPFMLLLGFAVWRVIEATASTPSMYLNALQAVRFQVVCAMVMAISALTLKLQLIRQFGVVSLPWITLVCYLACSGLPIWFFLRRNRRLQSAIQMRNV